MANAIEFDHVSKQYRLGLVSTKTLSHDIRRFWITNVLGKEDPYLKIGETNDRAHRGSSEYVWALRDIDFSVEQGDVVGIIGKNGAGKSTLLKLLSRVTGPTTGQIRAHGRIGSLLEVGTGFHQEMTGRENIYMNGAILGMTKSEIDRKLDEIVDFSGCERYIDTPVKRYSSGMMVRLGFAVAAHLEPEILVVDEVLAVGDAEFQKKAIGKMQNVAGDGRTVLFVSHNMQSIRNLCKRGVLLENGTTKMIGDVNEVVDYYLNGYSEMFGDVAEMDSNHFTRHGTQTKELELLNVKRLNPYAIDTNDELQFELTIKVNKKTLKEFQIISMIDDIGNQTERVGMAMSDVLVVPGGRDTFKAHITIKDHNLTRGRYIMDFWLCMGDVTSAVHYYDTAYDTLTFEVDRFKGQFYNSWERYYGQNCYTNTTVELF